MVETSSIVFYGVAAAVTLLYAVVFCVFLFRKSRRRNAFDVIAITLGTLIMLAALITAALAAVLLFEPFGFSASTAGDNLAFAFGGKTLIEVPQMGIFAEVLADLEIVGLAIAGVVFLVCLMAVIAVGVKTRRGNKVSANDVDDTLQSAEGGDKSAAPESGESADIKNATYNADASGGEYADVTPDEQADSGEQTVGDELPENGTEDIPPETAKTIFDEIDKLVTGSANAEGESNIDDELKRAIQEGYKLTNEFDNSVADGFSEQRESDITAEEPEVEVSEDSAQEIPDNSEENILEEIFDGEEEVAEEPLFNAEEDISEEPQYNAEENITEEITEVVPAEEDADDSYEDSYDGDENSEESYDETPQDEEEQYSDDDSDDDYENSAFAKEQSENDDYGQEDNDEYGYENSAFGKDEEAQSASYDDSHYKGGVSAAEEVDAEIVPSARRSVVHEKPKRIIPIEETEHIPDKTTKPAVRVRTIIRRPTAKNIAEIERRAEDILSDESSKAATAEQEKSKAKQGSKKGKKAEDSASKHVVAETSGLPLTRKYIILNRRNAAAVFNDYLNSKRRSEQDEITGSLNTIIMK